MIINNIKSHQAALENQSFLHLRNVCKMSNLRGASEIFHSFFSSFISGGKDYGVGVRVWGVSVSFQLFPHRAGTGSQIFRILELFSITLLPLVKPLHGESTFGLLP